MSKLSAKDRKLQCKFALCKQRPTVRISQGKLVIPLCNQHFRHYNWQAILKIIFKEGQPVKIMGRFS